MNDLRESIVLDKELQGYIDKYDAMLAQEKGSSETDRQRKTVIEKIEEITSINADWSSLRLEQLQQLESILEQKLAPILE